MCYQLLIHYHLTLQFIYFSASKEAEHNVKPSLCLTLIDERKTSISEQIQKQKKTFGFEINAADTFVNLYSESSVRTEVLQNLQKLGSKYPELIPKEVVDTIVYKDAHGTLEDSSAHNDVEHTSFSVNVYYDKEEESTTVNYCTATTIN